jgi:hypothetical protein
MSTTDSPVAAVNGSAPDISKLTPDALKAIRSQIAKLDRAKSKKRMPSVLRQLGECETIQRGFLVEKQATEWEQVRLNQTFSRDNKAHILYVKKGRTSAINLNTLKSERIDGASVYVVHL